MNNTSNSANNIVINNLYNQIIACSRKDKESEIKYRKIYYSYGIIGFILPILIEIILRNPSIASSFVDLELIILIIIGILILIPISLIILIITFRTGYYKFVFQLLLYFFVPLFCLDSFILTYLKPASWFPYAISFFMFVGYYIIVGHLNNNVLKKPLFSNDKWEYYASMLLSYNAIRIPDRQDGYSQRPVFTNFNEIKVFCPTFEDFTIKIIDYIKFLKKKGELIGWRLEDKKIILYPRVLLNKYAYYLRIDALYRLLIRIYRQQGLTAISIDYKAEEISITIAKEDYDELADVTYHLIGERLSEIVKQSIIAYIQNKSDLSYQILYPNVPL